MINITKQSLGVAPVDASEKWGRLNRNKLGVDQPRTGVHQQICKGIRPTNIAIQVFANISGNLISVQLSRRPWCTSVMFSIAFLGPKTTKVLIILDRFKVFVSPETRPSWKKNHGLFPFRSLQKASKKHFIHLHPQKLKGVPKVFHQGLPSSPTSSFLSLLSRGRMAPAGSSSPRRVACVASASAASASASSPSSTRTSCRLTWWCWAQRSLGTFGNYIYI